MPEPTIVCPTFARAGKVKSFGVFREEDMLLVVAEHQLPEYRWAYPSARFDPHPDALDGLPLVRQWLYERFGDVFMVDDDVPAMIDYTGPVTAKVDRMHTVAMVNRLADQAQQMGAYLFGFSEERNPLHYRPHKPFRLTGVVRGRAMGLLAGARFFFPADRSVDDEMCLCGLNAYFHRFCLVDERYAMPGDEYTVGGLASRRNSNTLRTWVEKLQVMFGDAVTPQPMGDAKLKVPW